MADAGAAAAAPAPDHYNLVVIGGGSGGLACAKQAASYPDVKVACLDFVTPTPMGTTWGLGGTCVNVGCIPKKLFHQSSLLGEMTEDAQHYGWKVEKQGFDWEKLVGGVQDHIGSLNWGYRTQLRSMKVDYINALGRLVDRNTIECTDKKGAKKLITADRIVIAVGGRPKYLDLPNEKECCITSDDLFSLSKPPGKTLCIGASYIALECAGFCTGLGYDTTVMVRSIFLRGFDQECAELIAANMAKLGTKFVRGAVPVAFAKEANGQTRVTWKNEDGSEGQDLFDTVLVAVGRYALTKQLNVEEVGVRIDPSSLKVIGGGPMPGDSEQSSVDNIYALGDCLQGCPELTPAAIQAGRLLARRLFDGSDIKMDYENIATTVFTPYEYGCVGLSEEAAIARYGKENIETYLSNFTPLEHTVSHRGDNMCRVKVICVISEFEKVVGMHIVGINAGEVIQGFALAVKMGVTKLQLDNLVGIHPTCAEEFTDVSITRRSGKSTDKSGC